jgi:hypothetical protein
MVDDDDDEDDDDDDPTSRLRTSRKDVSVVEELFSVN